MGCQASSSKIISKDITPKDIKIIKKNQLKKKFDLKSSSISPSVAEAVEEMMLVDIPDPFKISYKIIEFLHQKNYRKLYIAYSKEKREVIIEFTDLNLFFSSGYNEIDYFTRLDILRQFDHPSIPKVLDFFDGKETNRIVFEMASGKDLNYLLKAKGPPKPTVKLSNFSIFLAFKLTFLSLFCFVFLDD